MSHGLIRRLISPRELGERLKPFVFFDHLEGEVAPGFGFPFHPHSGIATLTYQLDADVDYEDTTGQRGRLRATGLEWMQAGAGAWHRGVIQPAGPRTSGFQIWLALPPEAEVGPSRGLYVAPEGVAQVGKVHVLLGQYGGVSSSIETPMSVSYLDVSLADGERWDHAPPDTHSVLWVYVHSGEVLVAGERASRSFLLFDETPGKVVLTARGPSRLLVGSAAPHRHALVLGPSSVHTNAASLTLATGRIRELGAQLAREGRLPT